MIDALDLIENFKIALEAKWGYIWGTSGVMWTDEKQAEKVKYMATRYGSNWKDSEKAKKDNYYNAARYGGKWVGRVVADCSGLFVWAFRDLGGHIYHGSNTIWDKYCSNQGKLNGGKRTDGKPLLPGTAVFVCHDNKRTHIGLYVGDGRVIEASSTQAGVVTTAVGNTKWSEWGELRDVRLDGNSEPNTDVKPTLRRGDKGEWVTTLQTALLNRGYDLGTYGVDGDFGRATEKAVKAFQADRGLEVDGIVGPKTWEELEKTDPVQLYTVHIPSLSLHDADDLTAKFPGSWRTAD